LVSAFTVLPENPTESTGSSNCKGQNSHIYAFGIDVFMTILALLFWLLDKKKKILVYFASGFIILAHGILHWFLQQETIKVQVNCYDPNLGEDIEGLGYILFGAFSFFLGLVILGFLGFGLQLNVVAGSAVFAGIVINVTKSTGGELMLPGLFCIVHPLSCFTGLFSNEPAFNTNVAKLFVVCTIVGIVELTSCTDILKPIGGHLWYDLTLHAAVLAALPPLLLENQAGLKITKVYLLYERGIMSCHPCNNTTVLWNTYIIFILTYAIK
jgi:hypothetical protein